jgi:diguanylate cyclase (GGDEF)-like protein
VCVPINAGGVLVGVLHATGPVGEPPGPATTDQLVTLASQTGARIGSMRTLESSRVEATTDGLTGVANRRMLNATLADLLRTSTPFVLVVADLDRFKALNDTYGHEVGDRALQLFAQVLQGNVRGRDLVARYGGEEFVLVYPEMNVSMSMEVLERIRGALAGAVAETDLPPFTASFGVTHSSVGTDVDSIVRIADAGLLMAKDLGRDRVVYSDAELAAEIFSNRADDRPPERH